MSTRRVAQDGFTLVELLVVVVIIGILATIGTAAFLSQRRAGWKAQVQADLRQAVGNAEAWAAARNGRYDTGTETMGLSDVMSGLRTNSTLTLLSVTTTEYCLQAVSLSSADVVLSYRPQSGTYDDGPC